MEHEPKISLPVAFLLIIGALIIDIVPVILIFIGLPDFFIPGIISFISVFYLKMKGMSITRDLVASSIELIPYVSALPIKTAVMAVTIWIDRHPESTAAKITQKAAKVTSIKRGKVGAPAPAAPGIKTPVGALSAEPAVSFAKSPTSGFKQAA